MTSESNVNQVPFRHEGPDVPGAFPETPADESGPQLNNPRGWNDSTQTPRTHEYTDSGISGIDSNNSTSQSRNYTLEKNHNDSTSRAQDHTTPSVAQQQTHSTMQPHGNYEQGATKPGFMTGAYSRVGNNSNQPSTVDNSTTRQATGANASRSNPYTQNDTSAVPEKASRSNDDHVHIKGTNPTTVAGGVGAASAAGREGSLNSSVEEGQRNLVRNGRGRSEIDHEEPYWGELPRGGGGVYNTVVGAGSDEKNPATQHKQDRTIPPGSAQHLGARDGTSASNLDPSWHNEGVAGNGVHNTIIGTGSDEDRSTVNHQRVFPLTSSHNDTTSHGEAAGDHVEPSSRFHENLAEAGSGAGAGYAAQKYTQGHEEGPTSTTGTGTSSTQYAPASAQQSNNPYTQKHLSETPTSQSKEEKHHHYGRDAALVGAGTTAAGYGAHKYATRDEERQTQQPQNNYASNYQTQQPQSDYSSNYQTGNPYAQQNTASPSVPSARQNHTLSSVPETNTASRGDDDSHFGRNAALAGAGAGAAGYGAHKYGHRDDENAAAVETRAHGHHQPRHTATTSTNATSTTRGQPSVTTGTEQRTVPTETSRNTRDLDSQDAHHHNGARNGAAGTTAGAAAAAAWNAHEGHSSTAAANQYQQQNQPTAAGTATHTATPATRGSTINNSSHGGQQYNTLADGTPSGVNLHQHQNQHQGSQHTGSGNANVSSSSGSRNAADGYEQAPRDKGNHTGDKVGAGAALGAGALACRERNQRGDEDVSKHAYDNSNNNNNSAAATRGSTVATSTTAHPSRKDGKYDELADGTPSGINVNKSQNDNNNTTSLRKPQATGANPTTTTTTRDAYNNPNPNSNSTHNSSKATAAAGAAGVAGAGAGAGAYGARDHAVDSKQSHSRHNNNNASVSSHSSTDSSKGGQYNVLSSGTPSGINISGGGGGPHSSSHDAPQTLLNKRKEGEETAPPARYQ